MLKKFYNMATYLDPFLKIYVNVKKKSARRICCTERKKHLTVCLGKNLPHSSLHLRKLKALNAPFFYKLPQCQIISDLLCQSQEDCAGDSQEIQDCKTGQLDKNSEMFNNMVPERKLQPSGEAHRIAGQTKTTSVTTEALLLHRSSEESSNK